jgi:AcrR family transcriptional regulator
MAPRAQPNARERILDAAETVLLRSGSGGLSIDAVVREAELSKGGFFHHFTSKDELLAAILQRLVAVLEGRVGELAALNRHPRGQRLRAHVQLALDGSAPDRQRCRAFVLALVAAATEGAAIQAAARTANDEALARAEDQGVATGRALAVQLALDGLWLRESLGTMALDARQRAALRATLLELVDGGKRKAGAK